MSKLTRYLLCVGPLFCASTLSLGQTDLTLQKQSPSTKTNSPYSAKALPIVSPGDFKTSVTQMGQQTQKNLKQQLNQTLKPLSVAAPKQPGASVNENAPETKKPTKKNTSQPVATQETSTDTSVTTTPSPVTQETQPTAPPEQPDASAAPAMPSSPPYTGFGTSTGTNNNTNTTNQPASSGAGLNIKY